MTLHVARSALNSTTGQLEVELCPTWSDGCRCDFDRQPGHALYHFAAEPADPRLSGRDRSGRRRGPGISAGEWAARCAADALALERARLGA